MKITMHLLARLGVLPLLVMLSVGSASAQTNIGKTILDKLTAKITKLEKTCAGDIKKYCKDVTPGEGRMVYCMQAHEDKISPKCAYELGETAVSVQASADLLKDGRHCLQSRDNRRVREDTAGPGSNRRMSDREQIDGFEGLRRRHSESRSHGGSMIRERRVNEARHLAARESTVCQAGGVSDPTGSTLRLVLPQNWKWF